MMRCAKFGLNGPSGSGEEDFWKYPIYVHYMSLLSPLIGHSVVLNFN